MGYRYREIQLSDTGDGTATIPGGRLVAFQAEGGTVAFNNRGLTFIEGERLEGAEEFVAGELRFFGTPSTKARVFFRF